MDIVKQIQKQLNHWKSLHSELNSLIKTAYEIADGKGTMKLSLQHTNYEPPKPKDKLKDHEDSLDSIDAMMNMMWSRRATNAMFFGMDPAGREPAKPLKTFSSATFTTEVSDCVALEVLGHIIREKQGQLDEIYKNLESLGFNTSALKAQ